MIADILIAFVFSLIIELFSSMGKTMKRIFILIACATFIVLYFVNGYTMNFIGTMDFGMWILFVVMFNTMITLLEQRLVRYFKNQEKQNKVY